MGRALCGRKSIEKAGAVESPPRDILPQHGNHLAAGVPPTGGTGDVNDKLTQTADAEGVSGSHFNTKRVRHASVPSLESGRDPRRVGQLRTLHAAPSVSVAPGAPCPSAVTFRNVSSLPRRCGRVFWRRASQGLVSTSHSRRGPRNAVGFSPDLTSRPVTRVFAALARQLPNSTPEHPRL